MSKHATDDADQVSPKQSSEKSVKITDH
jgi:hypothetical protein